jgi:Response regulator containing CheY-like receiver, AAA-type ATPase, and DNA-binding domains
VGALERLVGALALLPANVVRPIGERLAKVAQFFTIYRSAALRQGAHEGQNDGIDLPAELIKLKEHDGLYREAAEGVSVKPDGEFAVDMPIPSRMAETSFDVVITDLKMEGADGFQVVERAHELLPGARIVVITGFATLDTAKESFRKGAFDFVAKPFKLGGIIDCVRRIEAEMKTQEHAKETPHEPPHF